MIIQVLGSLKKNNKDIRKFFNRIDDEKQCNIKNIYFISNYLYGEENFERFRKLNLLKDTDKRKDNNIFKFFLKTFSQPILRLFRRFLPVLLYQTSF